jgi:SAM-dependent methyltransferase
MLREHLSQGHDAASRRTVRVDECVAWIHRVLLGRLPCRVLDLGCGPGLYASRLARLGHEVVGVDFSPVSPEYARSVADAESLSCSYVEGDLRDACFGADFDIVMQIYEEINVFRPADARLILGKARAALRPGGRLLLEPQRAEAVERSVRAASTWRLYPDGGLFADDPHIVLESSFWDTESRVGTRRMDVVDLVTGDVACHALSNQAYTEDGLRELLTGVGFADVTFREPGSGLVGGADDFLTVTARRPRATGSTP